MLLEARFPSARSRRVSIEGSWILIGQGAAVLGSIVGVRVMTGLLNPAAYGELALGMTAATLVNQTILGPLLNGVSRFYARRRRKRTSPATCARSAG